MATIDAVPPALLQTDRLIVRCWQEADAPALKEAIDGSLEHLRPWMPWAHREPQPLESKAELIRSWRERFECGEDFIYGVFPADESRVLGGCGLHRRGGPRSLEIGYWIRADATRQGLATEVVQMLARAAFESAGIERLDIVVEPENIASASVPRKLGFLEEARLRRRLLPVEEAAPLRDSIVFTMVAEEYQQSGIPELQIQVTAALGSQGG